MRINIAAITVVALTIITAGCASTPSGPIFKKITVESDVALVYVYRPQRHYGKALEFPVLINDVLVANIGSDGYFPIYLKPDSYVIQSDNVSIDEKLEFQLNAGDVVYLRYTINMHDPFGLVLTHYFKNTSENEAWNEIRKCRLETDRFYGYKK